MSLDLGDGAKARLRSREGMLRDIHRRTDRTPVKEQDVVALREVRTPLETLMDAGDIVARLGCHQIPERCFHIRGRPMRACARCVGCDVGQVLAVTFIIAGIDIPIIACVIGPLVMLADWTVQEYLDHESTNPRRFVTGLAAGVGPGTLYYAGFLWLCSIFQSVVSRSNVRKLNAKILMPPTLSTRRTN